ncbi:MAG: hypothetical protein ACOH1V_12965 [Stenotrophomonas sp.]
MIMIINSKSSDATGFSITAVLREKNLLAAALPASAVIAESNPDSSALLQERGELRQRPTRLFHRD